MCHAYTVRSYVFRFPFPPTRSHWERNDSSEANVSIVPAIVHSISLQPSSSQSKRSLIRSQRAYIYRAILQHSRSLPPTRSHSKINDSSLVICRALHRAMPSYITRFQFAPNRSHPKGGGSSEAHIPYRAVQHYSLSLRTQPRPSEI